MLFQKSLILSSKQFLSFKLIIFIACSIFLISACGSARKSFENKKYEKAIKQALKGLDKGKKVKENKNILKRSLDKIEKSTRKEVGTALKKQSIAGNVEAYNLLEDLEDVYQSGQAYLDSLRYSRYINLRDETQNLRNDISYQYFDLGYSKIVNAKSRDSKALAREAYYEFQSARNYGYLQNPIDSLIDESVEYGRLYYIVNAEPIFDITYGWEIDRVFDNIDDESTLFNKIYFEPIGNPGVPIDCTIDVDFVNLDIDIDKSEDNQRFTERIVVDYKETVDTSGNVLKEPIYGDIEAYVNIIQYTKSASWDVRVDINSTSKHCILDGGRFSEEITDQAEEIRTSGDERALPSKYRNINNQDELTDDDDMAEELIDRVYRRVIRNYLD